MQMVLQRQPGRAGGAHGLAMQAMRKSVWRRVVNHEQSHGINGVIRALEALNRTCHAKVLLILCMYKKEFLSGLSAEGA